MEGSNSGEALECMCCVIDVNGHTYLLVSFTFRKVRMVSIVHNHDEL